MTSTKIKIHGIVRHSLDISVGSAVHFGAQDDTTSGLENPLYQRMALFGAEVEEYWREKRP